MNATTCTSLGKKALYSVLIAGGITVLGSTAASALDLDIDLGGDDGILSDTGILGDGGILSDTGVLADIGVPITVEKNSISVIGDSAAGSSTPAEESNGATVLAPVNSILSIGLGDATGWGGIQLDLLDGVLDHHANGPVIIGDLLGVWLLTPGQLGIGDIDLIGVGDLGVGDLANGTDVDADAMVPVTVENNSISVIGDSSTGTGEATEATSSGLLGDVGVLGGVNLLGTGGSGLLGDTGILNGTGLAADAALPVSVTCNSVSVIGSSSSGCATAAAPGNPGDPGDASTPGATGGGLAGTGAADVTGVMGLGALALVLGVIVTLVGRRFGVSA